MPTPANVPENSANPLPPWDNATYPDEPGFRRRSAPLLGLYAAQPVGIRCQAVSRCPDTGLTVRVYALEGEEISSPYTGRRYTQGDTGYFGPKARGADGRITAFGGDPLKYDLPPALARLLLHPGDAEARAFLSIPGSLNQQYHFAAANWVRFYALLADTMGETWKREFADAVAAYTESRRPSDGAARENLPLSHPHDLVGETGELLGGRVLDGGTENHKTMWRTSGLLYAQLLGPKAVISGVPAPVAEKRITAMLTGFLRTILTVGNGEYDSSTYYPYSLRAYLNLYDLSPKAETRALGKAMLDYYVAAYGLKVIGGVHAGASKRGWAGDGDTLSEMDAHLCLWADHWADHGVTVPADSAIRTTSIHQATTGYRPNRVLVNLLTKNVPLPFEARMARPTYHSKERNAFQESFYGSQAFALGSVAMTAVDNPAQQTVWSLVCPTERGALVFGGGQPRYRHPEGHSPYDQVIQKRGTLVLLTGPTLADPEPTAEEKSRADTAADPLVALPPPRPNDAKSLAAFWEAAPTSAASWLFVPRGLDRIIERREGVFLKAGGAFLAVRPVGGSRFWLDSVPEPAAKERSVLEKYRVLVIPAGGEGISGYVLDTDEASRYPSLDAFADAAARAAFSATTEGGATVAYTSLLGDTLTMRYRPAGLRADGTINGKAIDWDGWAGGGVYESPYLTIKDGRMTVSDGTESYTVRCDGDAPIWQRSPQN